MDYIEGKNLQAILQERGRIPEKEVINWAKQLCEILDFLHNQNPPIIFRDLKPSNIMLTLQGEIKLVDFGIARHFRPGLGSDTSAYGSAGFAPPEQYGDRQTNIQSDLYALGATLHFLLTGIDPKSNPFIFEEPIKFVDITSELNNAIMKCLEFRNENRPVSVRHFWEMATGESWPQTLREQAYKFKLMDVIKRSSSEPENTIFPNVNENNLESPISLSNQCKIETSKLDKLGFELEDSSSPINIPEEANTYFLVTEDQPSKDPIQPQVDDKTNQKIGTLPLIIEKDNVPYSKMIEEKIVINEETGMLPVQSDESPLESELASHKPPVKKQKSVQAKKKPEKTGSTSTQPPKGKGKWAVSAMVMVVIVIIAVAVSTYQKQPVVQIPEQTPIVTPQENINTATTSNQPTTSSTASQTADTSSGDSGKKTESGTSSGGQTTTKSQTRSEQAPSESPNSDSQPPSSSENPTTQTKPPSESYDNRLPSGNSVITNN